MKLHDTAEVFIIHNVYYLITALKIKSCFCYSVFSVICYCMDSKSPTTFNQFHWFHSTLTLKPTVEPTKKIKTMAKVWPFSNPLFIVGISSPPQPWPVIIQLPTDLHLLQLMTLSYILLHNVLYQKQVRSNIFPSNQKSSLLSKKGIRSYLKQCLCQVDHIIQNRCTSL